MIGSFPGAAVMPTTSKRTGTSSGMRARLTFAIATAVRPEILLVDEALAVGDAAFKRRSQGRIDEIRADAGTVVLVSHNLAEIRRCDRAFWLHAGTIRAEGDPSDVVPAYEEFADTQ